MNHHARFLIILLLVIILFFAAGARGVAGTDPDPADQRPELLWSIPTGSPDYPAENEVMVSCSGDVVATGYGAGIIELRNRTGALLGRWQSPQAYYAIWSLEISRDGRSVVAVLADPQQDRRGRVVYINRSGGLVWQQPLRIWFGSADISDDGSTVAVADGNRISFYDRSGTLTGSATLEEMIWPMTLAGDGSMAVAVNISNRDFNGSLYAIDRNGTTERIPPVLVGKGRRGHYLAALSGNGKYLAVVHPEYLRIYTRNGTLTGIFNTSIPITSLAISAGGETIIAGSQYYLWNFNTSGGIVWRYDDPDLPYRQGANFGTVAVSDDGGYAVATGWGTRILFFNRQGSLLWENQSPAWIIENLCLSGDGSTLAIGTTEDIQYFGTGIPAQPVRELPLTMASPAREQPDLPLTTRKAPVSALISVGGIIAGMFLIRISRRGG